MTDNDLYRLAVQVGRHLAATQRTLVTAESCTGGWVSKAMTDVPGSSAWFTGGVVAYSNALKQQLLKVTDATLTRHGAVSDATVREMAQGVLESLGGDVSVAVSGIAGPGGEQPGKPVGTVWFAWAWRHGQVIHVNTRLKIIDGDRELVRRRSVQTALQGILEVA